MTWLRRIWCKHDWELGEVVAVAKPVLRGEDIDGMRIRADSLWHARAMLQGTVTHRARCKHCGAVDVRTVIGMPKESE